MLFGIEEYLESLFGDCCNLFLQWLIELLGNTFVINAVGYASCSIILYSVKI